MTKFERQRRSLLICIVMLGLILTSMCGYVYAKYIKNETIKGQLTISAELGDIAVLEHQAVRQTDGSYKLDMTKSVFSNSYTLIPGLDVPKDPVVKISNKSHLDAYVFVKVVTNISDSNLSYALTDDWEEIISSTDGYITTAVYVYTAGTANPVTIDNSFGTNGSGEIPVLVSDLFEVKEGLNLTSDVYLNFYAYMGQAIPDKEPLYVYQTLFTT